MNIFYEIKPGLLKESSIALGFFDGVHPGHQAVIKSAVDAAARLKVTPALVTFKDHPRTRVLGHSPKLLTVVEQRLELFQSLGIETTLMLDFTEEICRLSPADYIKQVLIDCAGARSISVGFNHTFGRNREGTPDVLREEGLKLGFEVHVAESVSLAGMEVSSSKVREAVTEGQMDLAGKLLGRPFAVRGRVVRGAGRGAGIGFPTANLAVSDCQLLPLQGVYAGMARLDDRRLVPCVINLGVRPTVSDDNVVSVEAHLLDFDGDLYDRTLAVEFWQHLRPETRFKSIDELKNQIALDVQAARATLSTPRPGSRPLPA